MKNMANQLLKSKFLCRKFDYFFKRKILYAVLNMFFFSGQVLEFIPMEYLLQNELPAKFFVTDVDAMEGTLPNNLVTILNHLGPMLKSESRSIQLTAFSLLQK